MRRLGVFVVAASAVLAGCEDFDFGMYRPVSVELTTPEGFWRLDGAHTVTLDKLDWRVRIVSSRVDDRGGVPMLRKLVVEVENTSSDSNLVLAPGEVTLDGPADENIVLGPEDTVVLKRGETVRFTYSAGMEAQVLPYPFALEVKAYRGLNYERPRSVSIKLR